MKKRLLLILLIIALLASTLTFVDAASITYIDTLNDPASMGDYDFMILQNKVTPGNTTYTMNGDWVHWSNLTTGDGKTLSHAWGTNKTIQANATTSINGTLTLLTKNCVIGADGNVYNLKMEFSNYKIKRAFGANSGQYLVSFRDSAGLQDAIMIGTQAAFGTSGLPSIGVECEITLTIVDQNGNKVNGTFPYGITDLDVWDRSDSATGAPSGPGKYAESIQFITDPVRIYLGKKSQTGGNDVLMNNYNKVTQNVAGRVIEHAGNNIFKQAQGSSSNTYHFDYPNSSMDDLKAYIDYCGVIGILNSGSTIKWSGSIANTYLLYPFENWNGSVTVKYISDTGKVLQAESYVLQDKPVGTDYSTTKKTFTDYHFKEMQSGSAPASGKVMKAKQTVVYVYEHDKGSVDVTYQDVNGNKLEPTSWVKQNVDTGTSYSTTQKTFTGYTFKQMASGSAPKSGTVTKTTQHVIYVYEKNGSVDVTYQETNGNKLEPTSWVKNNVAPGTSYTTSPKTFKGFTYKQLASNSAAASGVVESNKTKHVIYLYERNKYTVTTSVVAGEIDTDVTCYYEDDVTIKYHPVDPIERYKLEEILIDGTSIDISGNESQYTFSNIDRNHTIRVIYAPKKYTITTEVVNGTIDPYEYVIHGESTLKRYRPQSEQYKLRKIEVNGVEVDIDTYENEYSFNNVTEDFHIYVEYVKKDLEVKYESDEGGDVIGRLSEWRDIGEVPQGSSQEDKSMYRFSHWAANKPVTLKSGTVIGIGEPLSMEDIQNAVLTENITFRAIHDKLYNINYTALAGGEVTGKTHEIRSDKETATGSTAEHLDGYRFLYWIDEEGNRLTMEEIKEIIPDRDRTFTAVFEKIPNVTLDKQVDKDTYNLEDELTWTIVVKQTIPDAVAKDIVVRDDHISSYHGTIGVGSIEITGLPNGSNATVNVVEEDQGEDSWSGYFTVNIDTLPAGAPVTITYKTKAATSSADGKIVNVASVTWDKGDDISSEAEIPRVVKVTTGITNGVITESSGDLPFKSNYPVEFSPNEGYRITEVRLNGVLVDTGTTSYPFSDLRDNEDIYVVCEKIPFEITTEVVNGIITDGETVSWGDDKEIIFAPNEGYQLVSVVVDGDPVDEVDTYIFRDIRKNHHIKVTYEKIPELYIEKIADKKAYNVGDTVIYKVTVKQINEDAIAKDVIIEDVFPVGIECSLPEGAISTEGGYILNISEIPKEYSFTYTGVIKEKGEHENTVLATSRNTPNEATATEVIEAFIPSPAITKTVNNSLAEYGDILEYNITIRQDTLGAELRNVVVKDTLPDGIEVIPETVKINGERTSFNDGAIEIGLMGCDVIEITYEAKVVSLAGFIKNKATLEADGYNLDANATFSILKPTLAITKAADKMATVEGETVTWEIAVTVQDAKAVNLVIVDEIPEGLEIVNIDAGHFDCKADGNLITLTSPSFIGEEAVYITTKALSSGEFVNTATISSDNAEGSNAEARVSVLEMPEEPTPKPPREPQKENPSPRTGDENNLLLYIGVLAVSAFGLLAFKTRKSIK